MPRAYQYTVGDATLIPILSAFMPIYLYQYQYLDPRGTWVIIIIIIIIIIHSTEKGVQTKRVT